MKLFKNITLTFGGLLCAIILNHYNCQAEGFNFMLSLGVFTFLMVSAFGVYLLVNDK